MLTMLTLADIGQSVKFGSSPSLRPMGTRSATCGPLGPLEPDVLAAIEFVLTGSTIADTGAERKPE